MQFSLAAGTWIVPEQCAEGSLDKADSTAF